MTGSFSSVALLAGTTITVVALISFGLGRAAWRAGIVHPWRLASSVTAGLIMWLGVTAVLAESGVLSRWSDVPPRWQLLPVTTLTTFVLLSLTSTFTRIIAQIPKWQPVALQAFRVGVELAFWRLHADGFAPVQVTFEGRNIDVLVGLTAPIVAAGIAWGWVGPRMTILWNLFGLTLLVNAIVTVFTSAPGPIHLAWPGEPFTAIADWPAVWIPAFLAPVAILLHTVSIRQALARTGDPLS